MMHTQRGNGWVLSTIVGITALGVDVEQQAKAGTFVRSGIEFCEIRAEGNRPLSTTESTIHAGRGSVGYSYALSRTETTVEQFYEFVDSYARVQPNNPFLLQRGITLDPTSPSGYGLSLPSRRWAATMTPRLAARFCNWLHNGKISESWAFESGAYDTSTFGTLGNAGSTDQFARSPGAKFWIPSLDEWIKGAFFDPNRFGNGVGGYWLNHGSQDTPLRAGLTADGGQTDAAPTLLGPPPPILDVGSYQNIRSPWGLADTSGGLRELTEGVMFEGTYRLQMGSKANDINWPLSDEVDWGGLPSEPDLSNPGFRLATTIPSPPTLSWLLLAGFASVKSRRCD